jgi:hypothetical protein
MVLTCWVTFCGVVWNRVAIAAWLSHSVPPSARISMRVSPSSVV